ncbi:MFS transporter [Nissabacter sp. SGAir0207]|uniref:MFS transporter n=1 Tax=Nissabacter sp. SGAir0207 TaxID=2126321 RepID=UPI0010CCC7AD|nr:MFS transporter [Nissabacter sp. SGAir0207]QCR38836.1 hypothetical protein C1N62_22155 [Nissabacter sp. SGAir0207]
MIASIKPTNLPAGSALLPLFVTHWLERLLFLSVSIVWPLKLVVQGHLTTPQAGLFYFILFSLFRASPILYAYLAKTVAREKIFLCGAVIESCAFLGMIFIQSPLLLMALAIFAGIGGGATSSMLLSFLEEVDKRAVSSGTTKSSHQVFNTHLLLINLAAVIAPLLAILAPAHYIASIMVLFAAFLFSARHIFRLTAGFDRGSEVEERKERAIDGKFLSEWLACLSVWAGCSVVYAILPSLDAHFLATEGVNFWLSFDAIIVTLLFFAMKRYDLFSENTPTNALKGLAAIFIALLIFYSGTRYFPLLVVAISLLSFGGYVAFGQLYGLAMATHFPARKTFYLSLLSMSGAIGEGGVQGLFWLTGSTQLTLFIVLLLVVAGMCPLLLLLLKGYKTRPVKP